jgi:hypothetical protein
MDLIKHNHISDHRSHASKGNINNAKATGFVPYDAQPSHVSSFEGLQVDSGMPDDIHGILSQLGRSKVTAPVPYSDLCQPSRYPSMAKMAGFVQSHDLAREVEAARANSVHPCILTAMHKMGLTINNYDSPSEEQIGYMAKANNVLVCVKDISTGTTVSYGDGKSARVIHMSWDGNLIKV